MSKNEYQQLFNTRKWKLALSFLEPGESTTIKVKNAGDLLTIRSRASELTRESKDKVFSVSLDFDNKQATITVNKKTVE